MYSWHTYLCLDYMPLKADEISVSFACSVGTGSLCVLEPRKLPEASTEGSSEIRTPAQITTFSVKGDNMERIFPSYRGMLKWYEQTLCEYDFG